MISLILLQYVLTIYMVTMRARIQCFNGEFMKQFNEEHSKAFPGQERAPQYGYPDSGCGYFGKKLTYANWLKMNNGQRCQINFLEQITFAITTGLITAFAYPVYAFWGLVAWFVGRLFFTIGYTTKGPQGRLVGALTMDFAMLFFLVMFVVSSGKLAGWW